jgi:hypothetical protein
MSWIALSFAFQKKQFPRLFALRLPRVHFSFDSSHSRHHPAWRRTLLSPDSKRTRRFSLSLQSSLAKKKTPQFHICFFLIVLSHTGWATSTTPHSRASDPAEEEALLCLEQGTQKLEEGDVEGAKKLYQRSVDIKCNASSLFNLGVTHYHLSSYSFPI